MRIPFYVVECCCGGLHPDSFLEIFKSNGDPAIKKMYQIWACQVIVISKFLDDAKSADVEVTNCYNHINNTRNERISNFFPLKEFRPWHSHTATRVVTKLTACPGSKKETIIAVCSFISLLYIYLLFFDGRGELFL